MKYRNRLFCLMAVFAAMAATGIVFRSVTDEPQLSSSRESTQDLHTHKFGQVRSGEVVRHNFKILNHGPEYIQIDDVQSTCGCTVAGLDSTEIPPGGMVDMPVSLNTKGKSGSITQPILVQFSDGTSRTYTLTGFVASYELDPLRIGPVLRGTKVSREVSLRWPPGVQREIHTVHFNEEKLLVTVTPESGTHQAHIELREDVPYGPLSESVTFHTNDPVSPEKVINVFAMVRYPIECESEPIMLGMINPGQSTRGMCRILSPYGMPLRIESVSVREGISIDWREERLAEDMVALHVSLSTDIERSYYKSILQLTAWAGEESRTFDVEIYGIGLEAALR